ncbi:hypothetical protein INT45_012510 [Circinella minor]|uniref:PH domain-containing protein n=1 Tax=Circinella minor TaxID=1195481 RepID=A0A8H7RYZ1_9FUNG|nr:hypothetical protein INT45_012510 [Circinella minor]
MSFADLQSGWLHKLSWVNIHRSWKRRYFTLNEKELRYYKHQGDIRPTGIIDLKHYREISSCSTKYSQWSFRIESACRHHASHILAADTEDERDIWMERIRSHIHKQHKQHTSCTGSSGYHEYAVHASNFQRQQHHQQPGAPYQSTTTPLLNNESVLDKWLERLDLQDNNTNGTSKSSIASTSPPSSSSSSPGRPHVISTSLPKNYVNSQSAATVTGFDHARPLSPESPSSSIFTTGSSSVTLSPPNFGESTPLVTPLSTNKNNDNGDSSNNNNSASSSSSTSKASMLANAFAISARSRLKKRVTSSLSDQQQQQPQQPSSPRTSNETTTSTRSSIHQQNNSNEQYWSTSSSGLDIFHFEEDQTISNRPSSIGSTVTLPHIIDTTKFNNNQYHPTNNRSSIEFSTDIPPPFTAPPPQAPLPPPPRNNNIYRRLSTQTHQTTSL